MNQQISEYPTVQDPEEDARKQGRMLVPTQPQGMVAVPEAESLMTLEAMTEHSNAIREMIGTVLKAGVDYGTIPGCGDKPTLLQPGSQKLCFRFNFAVKPEMRIVDYDNYHREYQMTVHLYNIQSGRYHGSGVATCSTLESKYRFRNAAKKCPKCSGEYIIKGKEEYGGGWLCWKKNGGCGEKFADGDKAIEGQKTGRIEHDNPPDYWNTCEKMAFKRAVACAILYRTAASDVFTQDIEDMRDNGSFGTPPAGDKMQDLKDFARGSETSKEPAEPVRRRRAPPKDEPATPPRRRRRTEPEPEPEPVVVTEEVAQEYAEKSVEERFEDLAEEIPASYDPEPVKPKKKRLQGEGAFVTTLAIWSSLKEAGIREDEFWPDVTEYTMKDGEKRSKATCAEASEHIQKAIESANDPKKPEKWRNGATRAVKGAFFWLSSARELYRQDIIDAGVENLLTEDEE